MFCNGIEVHLLLKPRNLSSSLNYLVVQLHQLNNRMDFSNVYSKMFFLSVSYVCVLKNVFRFRKRNKFVMPKTEGIAFCSSIIFLYFLIMWIVINNIIFSLYLKFHFVSVVCSTVTVSKCQAALRKQTITISQYMLNLFS